MADQVEIENFLPTQKENKNKLKEFSSKVNWFAFTLIIIFTTGSWIDISGVWCELPIIVHEAPESWRLPSILVLIMQLAQIGPLTFVILKWLFPKKVTFALANYIILGIGAISALLIGIFWRTTIFIFGEQRSIAFYILNFFLANLDGTSSLTFLPWLGQHFAKEYIIANYLGETFSALVPSIIGLIQGIGKDDGCYNETKLVFDSTKNLTSVEFSIVPIPLNPTFSVFVYFVLISFLLSLCFTSFVILNNSNCMKKHYKKQNDDSEQSAESSDLKIRKNSKRENVERFFLLLIVFLTTVTYYGFLPGLQTYSTLPYSKQTFYLSTNLSYAIMPIGIFLSIWSFDISIKRIAFEFIIGLMFSIYVIVISCLSPCPPLVHHWLGSFLSIFSWVAIGFIFMRVRCLIATKLQRYGPKALFQLGLCTFVGQAIGGVLVFTLVDRMALFKERPECVFDFSYCSA